LPLSPALALLHPCQSLTPRPGSCACVSFAHPPCGLCPMCLVPMRAQFPRCGCALQRPAGGHFGATGGHPAAHRHQRVHGRHHHSRHGGNERLLGCMRWLSGRHGRRVRLPLLHAGHLQLGPVQRDASARPGGRRRQLLSALPDLPARLLPHWCDMLHGKRQPTCVLQCGHCWHHGHLRRDHGECAPHQFGRCELGVVRGCPKVHPVLQLLQHRLGLNQPDANASMHHPWPLRG
jgi:hypothetical protein